MSDSVFDPHGSGTDLRYASALQQGISAAQRGLRTIGFWAAVSLPFLHVPLLLSGLDSSADLLAFAVLFGANLVGLLVGHQYETS